MEASHEDDIEDDDGVGLSAFVCFQLQKKKKKSFHCHTVRDDDCRPNAAASRRKSPFAGWFHDRQLWQPTSQSHLRVQFDPNRARRAREVAGEF